MNEYARDDKGNLIGVVQFDETHVERALGEFHEELEQFTPQEIEAALKVNKALLTWVWQNGNVRANGLGVRAAVLCWVFLEDVKKMKQSELSKVIGKSHRQSLNRWVMNFRDKFKFKNHHMKSDEAREHYKEIR